MPKRNNKVNSRIWGSEGGAGREGKYYYEHDDRVAENIRRVSFKPGSNRSGKQRNWDIAIRAHIEDDDVDMSAPGSSGRGSGRFNPYNGRGRNQTGSGGGSGGGAGRGSNSRRRVGRISPPITAQSGRKRFSDNTSSWFKVIIPHGGRYSKDYILKTLTSYVSPHVFIPLCYEVRGTDSSFFVDDCRSAEMLANADKRITTVKGFKLLVKVKPALPHVEVSHSLKEKIKGAMVKRYNADIKALDMSKFHRDPDLADNFTVALSRPNLMMVVIDIIAENIPELEAIDLSDNKIYQLEHLSALAVKVPNLKILHIGKNRIREIHQLDCLQGLRLEDLVLDGNPVCDKFQEQSLYVSEVRKRFPKVVKLDGVNLPPPIVFDVEEEFKMPTNKASFMCSEEGAVIVRQFLEQYYRLYDSNDRQQLIDAYHNDAMLSITSTYPPGQSSNSNAKLVNYISDSRNLLRVKESIRRQKLLYQGKLSVVSCLSKLPKTRHDPMSFAVDLPIFTPQLLMISVSGLFLEPESGKTPPLRSFNRVFVIVPFGNGFCITNEELFVTNATDEQSKVAFKSPIPTTFVPSQPVLTDDNMKQQMVEAFALQSGMNLAWSKKCLDETEWDFQRASFVFSELNKQGTIPPEAFIK